MLSRSFAQVESNDFLIIGVMSQLMIRAAKVRGVAWKSIVTRVPVAVASKVKLLA